MTQWEYKIEAYNFEHIAHLEHHLNEEGDDGWEAVSVVEKRPRRYPTEWYITYKRRKETE